MKKRSEASVKKRSEASVALCQAFEDECWFAGIATPLDPNGTHDPQLIAANATLIAISLGRNPIARSRP